MSFVRAGHRWTGPAAILLCFVVAVSTKKIFPIRPEARRQLLSLSEIATKQYTPTGSALSIQLPGLSATLTTDTISSTSATSSIAIPPPARNTSHTVGPDYRIVNQKYLPGGRTVPLNVTGSVKLSNLAGTYGRKPAMAKGMPMPDNTGVSLYADVVTVVSHHPQGHTERLETSAEQGTPRAADNIAGLPQAGIKFHGGPVIMNPKVVNIYYGNWDTCNKAEVNAEPATGSVEPFVNTAASLSWRQEANGAENKQNDEARDDGKPPELRPGSVDSNASSPAPGPAANVACSNPATPVIFDDFVKSLDQTCWMNIVKSYYDKDGNFLSNRVQFVSSMKVPTSDSCYQGARLSDAQLFAVVTCLLDQKRLTFDPDTLFLVITASETTLTSGFCSQYCGWHDHGTWKGNNVRYAFIGSALQCPSACMEQQKTSPNSIPEVDGLVSIGAHEIVEWITDPDGDAWYDDKGSENADKCAWNFGKTSPVGNAYYNVGPYKCRADQGCTDVAVRDGRYYLIQQNWINSGNGYCGLSWKGQ